MILVDSSVWIDHFRSNNDALAEMLRENLVATHPFVIGELACGNLRNRGNILADLAALPRLAPVRDEFVLHFIDEHALWGKGIAWIDVHLLAGARLANCRLWTFDKALLRAEQLVSHPRRKAHP
ncbi:MAG TPA: PIN domain-containing protein [Candidatus Baltobacteraceae bacterium]|jgi:hypothetical protein